MKIRLIFLLPLIVLAVAQAAWSWGGRDHRLIVQLALRHVPPALAAFLEDELDEVLRGSIDPDRRLMDSANHSYNLEDGTLNNPRHVAYLSSALVSMIRNGAPREKVAYWFGALSHYVADIDQPLHTSDKDKRESPYHLLFEGLDYGFESHGHLLGVEIGIKVGRALSGWEFQYDGKLDVIEDVEAWQVENARWSNAYYDEIRRIYTEDDAFDAERLQEIYRTCIDEAVDDVIDLWAHVYRAVGGGAIDLPPASDVLILDVDKKGRVRASGERLKGEKLQEAIRGYASRSPAGDASVPAVYLEVDDRCSPRLIKPLEEICTQSGIHRVSTLRTCKGPWTSRLYRAVKVHAAALAK
ncbi:MAG: zinc dependent phospholipase C family protein [Planctomycetota bacterium]